MPNSNAEIGYDDRLQMETETPGVYADIEEVKDWPDFGDVHPKIDVTHHTSPGRRKEYVAGMKDASELDYECNWTRATMQEALRAAEGTVKNFRQIYKTTPPLQITFPATILQATINSPTEEVRKLKFKLQPTGDFDESDVIES